MRILLTGSLAVDQIMNFDGLFEKMIQPDKVHLLSISVLLKSLKKTRGGTAGNIAYSLALLGEKPALLASIGIDQKDYITDLTQLGVDTKYVHFSKIPTASFSVFTDKNDCQVGGFFPGAMSDAATLTLQNYDPKETLVVLSAHDPAQMAIQIDECLEKKLRLCFDIGQQVIALSAEVLRKGLQAAEILILNDYELGLLAERAEISVEEIMKLVPTVVVTLGAKGCNIFTEKNKKTPLSVDATKVSKVIDPTGAGDGFRAGFLYGYVRHWDLKKAAQLGATVAAYVVEQHGTQEHFFQISDLQKRYESQYHQQLVLNK